MNYLIEINSFYDWLETNPVSDSAIVLWQALMHVNNKTGWKEEFAVAISTLELKTSLSKSSIIRARNILKQTGRIDFRSREGQQSAIYRMVAFHTDTQTGTQSGTQTGTQSGTQTVPIPKLNKTETKQNNSFPGAGAPAKKTEKREVPFWKEFVEVWSSEYKNRIGEPFEFLDRDFSHLKKIYRFLEKRASKKNFEWTEVSATDGFRKYIEKAWKKDEWLRQNFTITNLLTQFNQIVNGNEGASANGKQGAGVKVTGAGIESAFNEFYRKG